MPEMIAHAMGRARGGHWLPQELPARQANLRRGRAALGQQVERLTDAYLAGVVPLAEYERRRRDADARLQALDRQEHELAHDAECQGGTAGLAAHAEAFCQRVRKGLADAGFNQKRTLLEPRLVDRVIVTDGMVQIAAWSQPVPMVNASRFGDCVQTVEISIPAQPFVARLAADLEP